MWNLSQVNVSMLERTSNAATGWVTESSSNLKAVPNIICTHALQSPQRCVNTLFITVMSEGISLESCTLMLRSDSVQLMLP